MKKKFLKTIIALGIILTTIISFFGFNNSPKLYADSNSNSWTINNSTVGEYSSLVNNSTPPKNWQGDSKDYHTTASDFWWNDGSLTLSISTRGVLTITKTGSLKSAFSYNPDSYTYYTIDWGSLSLDEESWYEDGYSETYYNKTKFTKSGCNIFVGLDSTDNMRGYYIGSNTPISDSSWATGGNHIIYCAFIIRYQDEYSDAYDNDTTTYYALLFQSEIMISDTEAPTITGISNGETTSNNVTLSISDNVSIKTTRYSVGTNNYSTSYSTAENKSALYFSKDGFYTVESTDTSNNTTILKFKIDKTAPTISGVESGAYYNTSKTITVSDAISGIKDVKVNGSTVTLTNNKYTISKDIYTGTITILTEDIVGNTASYTIYIDTMAPNISGASNNGEYKSCTIIYSDSGVIESAKYSMSTSSFPSTANTSFASGATFNEQGYYYIVITDVAGNTATRIFKIDKTAPTISGVESGAYYNTSKTITVSDAISGIKDVKVNGSTVTLTNNKYTISKDIYTGTITVIATDVAGNIASCTFYIDTTDPVLTVTNYNNYYNNIYYSNNKITISSNENVTFNYNGQSKTGRSITLNSTDFEAKKYVLTATDVAGNTATCAFYFDTTTPEINLKYSNEYNSIYYINKEETITFNSSFSPILSGYYINNSVSTNIDISKSLYLSTPGTYDITIQNAAGNTSTKKLIIDKTAPTITGISNGIELSNNSYTNNSLKITFTDNILLSSNNYYSYNSNQESIISGDTFFNDGEYTFVITDMAGNSSTLKITIEKEKPTITGVESGAYYNTSKTITVSDAISGIKDVKVNGSTVTLTNNKYTISKDSYTGTITVIATDAAGNTATYTFYIDTTAPIINVEDNKYYKNNINVKITDFLLSDESYFQKDDESPIYFSEATEVTKNTFGDGKYYIEAIDKAGNITTRTFYIDTIAPEGIITGYTTFKNNKYYANSNSIISFNFNSNEATASFNNTIYNNFFSINCSTIDDGEYTIILTDAAGNTTEYQINIKSSIPQATITGYSNYYGNKYYANETSILNITWTDSSAICYVSNGEEYRSSFTIICSQLPEGEYILNLTDIYNNSSSYLIEIDKTKDYNNYNHLKNNNYSWTNHWFNTFDYSYANSNYTVNNIYSFASYEEAETFARTREYSCYDTIKYTGQNIYASEKYGNVTEYYDYEYLDKINIGDNVYIYKSLTNSSKIVVYFNHTNLSKALDHYITESISECYKYFSNESKISIPYNEDLYLSCFYSKATELSLTKAEATTKIYVKNNSSNYILQPTNKTTIYSGTNYIKEEDIAGNIIEYIVILNNTPITFSIYDENGKNDNYTTTLRNQNKLYAASPITLTINSLTPNNNTIKITYTNLNKETITYYKVNDGMYLDDEGSYTIETYDICGNKSTSYDIYVLYSQEYKPNIIAELNKVDGIVKNLEFNISYYKLVDKQITNILVAFTAADSNTKKYLTSDGDNNPITKDTTNMIFYESGLYEISLTDLFGNEAKANETLQKDTPFGQLFAGNPAVAIPSGTIINQNIYFSYNISYGYTCLLNDAVYTTGTLISKEGTYEFILSNSDKIAKYTATIDKTAPEGNILIDGIPSNSGITTSSKNVIFTFDENDATATLNNQLIRSNQFITSEGKNTIILTDTAGNTTEYIINLDFTAPKVKIYSGQYEVESGSIVNQKIKFVWDEYNCIGYVNGVLYTSGKFFSTPGTYVLSIKDAYNNTAEYIVTLDLSQPEYDIIDSNGINLKSGSKINNSFYITWIDDNYTVYLNSNPYIKGTSIDAPKNYTIQVINIAGTISESNISISYLTPEAKIFNYDNTPLESGSITNQRFYITWTDSKTNRYTCLLNDSIYSNGNIVRNDNLYTIKIIDEYNNFNTYYITKDTIAPEGYFEGVVPGGITNQNVCFYPLEENTFITLNDILYESGSEITTEGLYVLQLTDAAGNTTEYQFEIDKTAPTFDFSISPNEFDYINAKTSITWTENNCTAKLNDIKYLSGNKIYDGSYVFSLTDAAGNTSSKIFIVDTTAPIIFFDSLNKNKSNKPVKIYWTDDNYTVYLNDLKINNNATIEADGIYHVIAYNLAGNSTEYQFEISTKKPEGILVGVIPGGITNQNVYFKYSNDCTATLNSIPYSSNSVISREGIYNIELIDSFDNKNTYQFEIDKTAPTATITGLITKKQSNSSVIFTFDENDATATLNTEPVTSNTEITTEGSYILQLTDIAGNTTEYRFEIDKTAPDVIFEGVVPGGITNQNVYIIWLETNATAYINGKIYKNNTPITNEGLYEFEIQDELGNKNTYQFEIDKTPPLPMAYTENGYNIKLNSIINEPFYVTWEEPNCTATLNSTPYYHEIITEDGEYRFEISDIYNNILRFTITIDRTTPIAIFEGVEPGGITNQNVKIIFSNTEIGTLNNKIYQSGSLIRDEGSYSFVLTNSIGNTTEYQFEIDKTAPTATITGLNNNNLSNTEVVFTYDMSNVSAILNDLPYYSGISITTEGLYVLQLTDIAGNTTEYQFEIDKTAPEGTLIGVENNGFTNKAVSFTWEEPNCTATLNDQKYLKNNTIKSDNRYVIILIDAAGNTAEYQFEISTKKPEIKLDGVNINNLSNTAVKIYYSKCKVTVNGEAYTNKEITLEGSYTIEAIDKYGNITKMQFEIDKTAPTFEVTGVENNGFTNKAVYITWTENNCTAYINNEQYISGSSIKKDNSYVFSLTDAAGNTATCTFEISSEATPGTLIGVENNGFTNEAVSFTWDDNSCSVLLDGISYESGSEITTEGLHVIQLINKYGNITNYNFTIDTELPNCDLKGVENNGFTNQKVIIIENENNLDIYVNNILWTKSYITLPESELYNGLYNIKVYDKARNYVEYNFEYYYKDLKGELLIEKNENSTEALLDYSSEYTLFINDKEYESGTSLSTPGTYNIKLLDKYGNCFETKLVINSIKNKNYTFRNISTIIIICLLTGIAGFIFIIKIKNPQQNPYKKTK